MATNSKNSFYGVIQEIWELDCNTFTIPLFKCKWVTNNTRGFTRVDLSTDGYTSDPFILAKLATQVDELPPFCDGVPPVDDDIVETTYLRSDLNEGLWVE
nr:hypothetical protein [Tanacetum cinerariifolium]